MNAPDPHDIQTDLFEASVELVGGPLCGTVFDVAPAQLGDRIRFAYRAHSGGVFTLTYTRPGAGRAYCLASIDPA